MGKVTIITEGRQGPPGPVGPTGPAGSGAGTVAAAAILLTPSLTPQVGDEIWTVIYSPGVGEDEFEGPVPSNDDFVKVTQYTYSGIWEADPNDFVLLMIDEGEGGQRDSMPTVYAKFTGTGFEPITLPGGTLVSLSCGGAGFGVPAVFVGSNWDSPLFGGTWPLGDAEFFQPQSISDQNVVTRYNYTGNLNNTNNLHQVLNAVDSFNLPVVDVMHALFLDTSQNLTDAGASIDGGVAVEFADTGAPAGVSLMIWNGLGSSENGLYTHDGSNTWVWSDDQPLSIDHFGDPITVSFDNTKDSKPSIYIVSTANGTEFGLSEIATASNSKYVPAVSSDWTDPDPTSVAEALDSLASASTSPAATNVSYTPAVEANWVNPDPSNVALALDELVERVYKKIMAQNSATPIVDTVITNNDDIGYISADTTNQDIAITLPPLSGADGRTIWFHHRNGDGTKNLVINTYEDDAFLGGGTTLTLLVTHRVGVKATSFGWVQLTAIA